MLNQTIRLRPAIKRQICNGYSLIELIITIVLSSFAIIIFFGLFSQNQIKSISPVFQIRAAELSQAYLEEISLKRFDENSPVGNQSPCDQSGQPSCSILLGADAGESRSNFDDVDDFDGLVESPPLNALGLAKSEFSGFRVSINVSYAGTDLGFSNRSLKKIQVVILSPEGDEMTFATYRGNF